MPKDSHARIAVLGGGPAGLSAAYAAARAGVSVDLYEAQRETGGLLRTRRVTPRDKKSFAIDYGPSSMQIKHWKVKELLDELELNGATLERAKKARAVYVMKNGALERLPSSPGAFLRSKLLSFRAKMGIFLEPFVRKLKDKDEAEDETVGAFFKRRFSPEVVRYIVDPAVAGIYSGNVDALSMRYTFPSLWNTEREKGSVLLPMLTRKRPAEAKLLQRSISFAGGMQTLPAALRRNLEMLGGKVYVGRRVRSVNRGEDGFWRVNRRGKYDVVISTIPGHALADMRSNIPMIQNCLQRIARKVKYAAVGTVAFGFRREQVAHPLDGFGALIPSVENKVVLGVQFASEGYPDKERGEAEKDKVFLTVYMGGMRNPEFAAKSEKAVVECAKREVSEMLGVKGEPCFSRAHIWEKAIPQYRVGYQDVIVYNAGHLERRAPGLFLAGNYKNGVGLPDALQSGLAAAERAMHYLEKVRSLDNPSSKGWPVD